MRSEIGEKKMITNLKVGLEERWSQQSERRTATTLSVFREEEEESTSCLKKTEALSGPGGPAAALS